MTHNGQVLLQVGYFITSSPEPLPYRNIKMKLTTKKPNWNLSAPTKVQPCKQLKLKLPASLCNNTNIIYIPFLVCHSRTPKLIWCHFFASTLNVELTLSVESAFSFLPFLILLNSFPILWKTSSWVRYFSLKPSFILIWLQIIWFNEIYFQIILTCNYFLILWSKVLVQSL